MSIFEDWLVESYEELKLKNKEYIFIIEKFANDSYKQWKESHKDRQCFQYIRDTMEKLGFKRTTTTINKVKGVPIYRIGEKEFEALITRLTPTIEDDGEEIQVDDLEFDAEKGTFFKVDKDFRI